MKPNFSPSLFPLCVSVSLWFKFQICLARIRITIRSRELELLEHQAKQGRFAEFRSFVIVVQRMEDHLVFRSAREGRLAGGSAFTVSP